MAKKTKKGAVSNYRDALKKKTEENYKDKDYGGFSGKGIFKLDGIDVDFYKVKEGRNAIDIIPYKVVSGNHPKTKKGGVDYLMDIWVHKKIGPSESNFICLKKSYGKACPICEHIEELKKDDEDEDTIEALTAKRRVFYNIIDTTGKESEIMLFEQSHFKFEKELLEEAEGDEEGEIIVFADPTDGKTIHFKGKKASFKGRDFLEIKKITLEDRDEQYDEDIVDSAISLDEILIIPSYDEMKDALNGLDSDDDDDEDDEPKKKKGKPAPKSKKKDDDDEEEEEDDEEEEEEDDEEEEEEDDEEEEEEEEEKPKKGKASAKKPEKKAPPKKEEKKKAGGKNKCPHGHNFGKDCDKKKECSKCDKWDECSDA